MLIDTHSHLYWPEFQPDIEQVALRSIDAGVTTAIIIGVNPQTSEQAVDFQAPPLNVYSSVGIHPHEAHRYAKNPSELIAEDIQKLETIALEYPNKVKLIGECGLDFYFNGNSDFIPAGLDDETFKNLQRQLFKAQIDLAKKLDLPLTVHCRDDRSQNPQNIDCWLEILEMIKDSKGVLHCYSGYPLVTKRALELDFLISFAANITYPKNQYLRDAAAQIPLSKIVLETDCPFLSPQSSRGQRNEPANVLEVAKCLGEIKNLSLDEVATQTTRNAAQLLNIKV